MNLNFSVIVKYYPEIEYRWIFENHSDDFISDCNILSTLKLTRTALDTSSCYLQVLNCYVFCVIHILECYGLPFVFRNKFNDTGHVIKFSISFIYCGLQYLTL